MSFKLLNVEKFLNSPQSGEKPTRPISTAKTFVNKDGSLVPNSGSFYDPSIFGFSSKEIFNQFAYIQLVEPVLHPFIFKNIGKINGIFKKCISKKINCTIKNSMLVEDEKGTGASGTGIQFIINNFNKINFENYRTETNSDFINILLKDKDLLIIKKIPVLPIGYRNYTESHGKLEEDDLTSIYKKIVNIEESKDWVSDSDNPMNDIVKSMYKNTSKKEYIQRYILELYDYFLDKLSAKSGFFRSALFGKRVDNVARYVINAHPDLPIDCAAVPWQGLLVTFDVFVAAYINKPSNENQAKQLGVFNIDLDALGKKLDYIFRNVEEYLNNNPTHEKLWIEVLNNIFTENPELRIIAKRDPGWTHLSWWAFKPVILTGAQYQMVVPSFMYSPIGGDSFKTNFIVSETKTNIIYEDNDIKITSPKKTNEIFNIYSYIQFLGFEKNNEKEINKINNTPIDDNAFEQLMLKSGIKKL